MCEFEAFELQPPKSLLRKRNRVEVHLRARARAGQAQLAFGGLGKNALVRWMYAS